jgi:3-hydroxy-3-methylglutaryl CoA synthase
MVGIKSYGVYIPYYRLSRAEIHNTWKTMPFPMKGERTVASFDEDSLTMAVAASIDCLAGLDRKDIDLLFSCSTTFPYREKLSSATIAMALDLKNDIRTADFCNSLRCATIGLSSAVDALEAGSAKNCLLMSSDSRLGGPGGEFEQSIGDGGAAFLLGKEDLIAEIEYRYTATDEFCGMWRSHEDTFIRMWEDRMVHDEGYSKIMLEAITSAVKKANMSLDSFAKIVYDAPADIRRHAMLARKLEIRKEQLQSPFFEQMGNTGSALASMMLVAALEEAKADDRILFASYGNGADVFILKVTHNISKPKNRGTFAKQLNSKKMIYNYPTYLRWRNIVSMEKARRPDLPPTSLSNLRRNAKIILSLYGVKCKNCGTPQYSQAGLLSSYVMPQRVCVECGTKDQFEDYPFYDKKGKICTYTQDRLAASLDPPLTVTIIDFEGGGRAAFEMTDRDPKEVKVGMPVELTFRKLFYERGIHNYYWKTRPIRG